VVRGDPARLGRGAAAPAAVAPASLGPVAYAAGVVQLVQGRAAAAAESFELALELSERMRARPYAARSRAGLAAALRLGGEPGDAARAEELSARATGDAEALGMTRLRRELGSRAGAPAQPGG